MTQKSILQASDLFSPLPLELSFFFKQDGERRLRREHFEGLDETRRKTTKKPEAYPLRYAEDFFVGSNEVAVKPSKCATGERF